MLWFCHNCPWVKVGLFLEWSQSRNYWLVGKPIKEDCIGICQISWIQLIKKEVLRGSQVAAEDAKKWVASRLVSLQSTYFTLMNGFPLLLLFPLSFSPINATRIIATYFWHVPVCDKHFGHHHPFPSLSTTPDKALLHFFGSKIVQCHYIYPKNVGLLGAENDKKG